MQRIDPAEIQSLQNMKCRFQSSRFVKNLEVSTFIEKIYVGAILVKLLALRSRIADCIIRWLFSQKHCKT